VVNTIDRLMMLGAKVVLRQGEGIHVSGHGLPGRTTKLMIALTAAQVSSFRFTVSTALLVAHSKTPIDGVCRPITLLISDNGRRGSKLTPIHP